MPSLFTINSLYFHHIKFLLINTFFRKFVIVLKTFDFLIDIKKLGEKIKIKTEDKFAKLKFMYFQNKRKH